jgi:hypothetical protein
MIEQSSEFEAQLGARRLRIVSCLGGDQPRSPHAAAWTAARRGASDPISAFRMFAEHVHQACVSVTDPRVRSLVAAARLLAGNIGAAQDIVDHFPEHPPRTDHGAGYCLTAPSQALLHALPLPPDLQNTERWAAGSPEQARLHAWLRANGATLAWHPVEGKYTLPGASPP